MLTVKNLWINKYSFLCVIPVYIICKCSVLFIQIILGLNVKTASTKCVAVFNVQDKFSI